MSRSYDSWGAGEEAGSEQSLHAAAPLTPGRERGHMAWHGPRASGSEDRMGGMKEALLRGTGHRLGVCPDGPRDCGDRPVRFLLHDLSPLGNTLRWLVPSREPQGHAQPLGHRTCRPDCTDYLGTN